MVGSGGRRENTSRMAEKAIRTAAGWLARGERAQATYMKVPRLLMGRAITEPLQYLHLVARAFTSGMAPRRVIREHELANSRHIHKQSQTRNSCDVVRASLVGCNSQRYVVCVLVYSKNCAPEPSGGDLDITGARRYAQRSHSVVGEPSLSAEQARRHYHSAGGGATLGSAR